MMTEPSLCAATAVFKPIAPAKTSMARNTTASLRDIVPPGLEKTPGRTLYGHAKKSSSVDYETCENQVNNRERPSPSLRLGVTDVVAAYAHGDIEELWEQRYESTKIYRTRADDAVENSIRRLAGGDP